MGPVTLDADDLLTVADWSAASLSAALDGDWSVPAGELAWTCRRTLDHIADALLLYAAQLARRADAFHPVPRDGDPNAPVGALLEVARSAAVILAAIARDAGPGARAFHPAGLADAEGFLGLGCDEVLVHTNDIASGLGIELDPPADVVTRVLARVFPWVDGGSADPWSTLLWANGRAALDGRPRLDPNWYWHCAPLAEWDGSINRRTRPPAW